MANEQLTHVNVTLDQAMLQTLRMGLQALQIAAAQVEVHLNSAVQDAIDAAKRNSVVAEAPSRPVGVEAEPADSTVKPPPRTNSKGAHA